MIEEMIYDKILNEIRVANRPFVNGKRPIDKKINNAYRAGLNEALRLTKRVLEIED